MKFLTMFLAVVLLTAGVVRAQSPSRDAVRPVRAGSDGICGFDGEEPAPGDLAARGAGQEFAGIVPDRGLAPEDFANGGLLIEVDDSLRQITADPVGVVTRAARMWEIPGTIVRFRVGGPGTGGNAIVARSINAAARATIGRPGWGARGSLTMTLDTPYSRGDDTLVAIIAHELGHWLGFDHSFLGESTMFPTLTDKLNWIDPDHTAKVVAKYAAEPNALGEVRGVITRAGAPLSGARINLIGIDDRAIFGIFSQPDGTYFLPVYAGTYRLFIDPNDGPAVAGNFRGTYPGGPLDYVTVESAGRVVVSAGVTTLVDMDVPVGGDAGFKITTAEPRTTGPGDLQQQIQIYYDGATPAEIASVESLSPDVTIRQVTDLGGEMAVYFDVADFAMPGQHTFLLRKTNGAIAILPGVVGVVGKLRLHRPHYSLEAPEGAPVRIEWESRFFGEPPGVYVLSASLGYGSPWEEIGRGVTDTRAFEWHPDARLTSPALRFRVEAFDAAGLRLGVDESIVNIGLGQPARGNVLDGPDTTAPSVGVLSPNGGEVLAGGEAVAIEWVASDDAALAAQDVAVSTDGGRQWTTVATVGPSARSFAWTPEAKASDEVLVRVVARDVAGNQGTDASDAAARVRLRPTVTSVTVKQKGDAFILKVKGQNFAAGAAVAINGRPVPVPVKFNTATRDLKIKGEASVLGLNPAGTANTIVVTVDGLASPESSF